VVVPPTVVGIHAHPPAVRALPNANPPDVRPG
jgi:hypothetical protein